MVATKNSARAVISAFPSNLPDFSKLSRFPTTTELTEMVEKIVLASGGYWDRDRERQCLYAVNHDGVEAVVEHILRSARYPREVISATLARMRGRLC
jgi:hypothetical protein